MVLIFLDGNIFHSTGQNWTYQSVCVPMCRVYLAADSFLLDENLVSRNQLEPRFYILS
jgi:hypothetical protein